MFQISYKDGYPHNLFTEIDVSRFAVDLFKVFQKYYSDFHRIYLSYTHLTPCSFSDNALRFSYWSVDDLTERAR